MTIYVHTESRVYEIAEISPTNHFETLFLEEVNKTNFSDPGSINNLLHKFPDKGVKPVIAGLLNIVIKKGFIANEDQIPNEFKYLFLN